MGDEVKVKKSPLELFVEFLNSVVKDSEGFAELKEAIKDTNDELQQLTGQVKDMDDTVDDHGSAIERICKFCDIDDDGSHTSDLGDIIDERVDAAINAYDERHGNMVTEERLEDVIHDVETSIDEKVSDAVREAFRRKVADAIDPKELREIVKDLISLDGGGNLEDMKVQVQELRREMKLIREGLAEMLDNLNTAE